MGLQRIGKRFDVWLILLTLLGILARLGYVLIQGKPNLGWGDEFAYDQLATNILQHGCYCFVEGQPSVLRAPLYPATLALLYTLFGHSYIAVTVVQAVLGGLGTPLLAIIGRRLSSSPWVGLVAGLIFAINPLLIFAANLLYPETLYLPLLLLMVYLWLALVPAPRRWPVIAVASGVLLGLSNLVKPNLLLFPAWLLVWGWFAFRDIRRGIVVAVLTLAALLAVVLPWSLRNLTTSGDFVLVSANTGLNLAQGNNSQVDGGALNITYLDPLQGLSETDRDAAYWRMGMDWIRSHPADFLRLIPQKLYKLFSPIETSNRGTLALGSSRLLLIGLIGFGLFYLLAVLGLIMTFANWRLWLLPYMLIAYPTLMTAVFYGGTRYGMVIQPFLMLFAAIPIVALGVRLFNKPRASAGV